MVRFFSTIAKMLQFALLSRESRSGLSGLLAEWSHTRLTIIRDSPAFSVVSAAVDEHDQAEDPLFQLIPNVQHVDIPRQTGV